MPLHQLRAVFADISDSRDEASSQETVRWGCEGRRFAGIQGGRTEGGVGRLHNPRDVAGSRSWLEAFPAFLWGWTVTLCVLYCSTASAKLVMTHSFQAVCLDWSCLPSPRRQSRVYFLVLLRHWERLGRMRSSFPNWLTSCSQGQ